MLARSVWLLVAVVAGVASQRTDPKQVLWVVAAAAGVANVLPRRPDPTWCHGVIERGSIEKTSSGVRFTIRHGWPVDPIYVRYDGALPDTVCDGSDVGLEGWLEGAQFEAIRVLRNQSKYDPCWQWHCRPDTERPEQCRRAARYQ